MSSKNRIDPLTPTVSIGRQTPNNEFGTVLARTLGEAAEKSTGLIGTVVGFTPSVSTAVAGAKMMGGLTSSANAANVVTSGSARSSAYPYGAGLPSSANASTDQLLQQVAAGGDGSSSAYLQLQMQMQNESQQFSAVSNILKVRSDSAKAAINNIR